MCACVRTCVRVCVRETADSEHSQHRHNDTHTEVMYMTHPVPFISWCWNAHSSTHGLYPSPIIAAGCLGDFHVIRLEDNPWRNWKKHPTHRYPKEKLHRHIKVVAVDYQATTRTLFSMHCGDISQNIRQPTSCT